MSAKTSRSKVWDLQKIVRQGTTGSFQVMILLEKSVSMDNSWQELSKTMITFEFRLSVAEISWSKVRNLVEKKKGKKKYRPVGRKRRKNWSKYSNVYAVVSIFFYLFWVKMWFGSTYFNSRVLFKSNMYFISSIIWSLLIHNFNTQLNYLVWLFNLAL